MSGRQIVTLTEMQGYVYARLGNSVFWTSSEVTILINEALRTWNSLTGYWHGRIIFPTSPNVPYYVLPAPMLFGAHAEFNGVPITQSSVFNWDQDNPDWEAERGNPTEWAPVGIGIIALRPVDAIGNQSITVDGISVTPILVNANDFVDIGQEDFKALLDYIEHSAVFKEGGAEFKSTMALYKQFMEQAAVRNEKLKATSAYRHVMGIDEDLQRKPIRLGEKERLAGVR